MSSFKIEVTENEDRPGVQVWIVRADGEAVSLACADNEGEFADGKPVPKAAIREAFKVAETVDY